MVVNVDRTDLRKLNRSRGLCMITCVITCMSRAQATDADLPTQVEPYGNDQERCSHHLHLRSGAPGRNGCAKLKRCRRILKDSEEAKDPERIIAQTQCTDVEKDVSKRWPPMIQLVYFRAAMEVVSNTKFAMGRNLKICVLQMLKIPSCLDYSLTNNTDWVMMLIT